MKKLNENYKLNISSQGFPSHVVTSENIELELQQLLLILSWEHSTQVGPLPYNHLLDAYYSSSIIDFARIVQNLSGICLKLSHFCRVAIILLFINKIHGHDKKESFILCPQARFKGLLHTDVVLYKFTNFHKKEHFSPSSAKTFNFYLT